MFYKPYHSKGKGLNRKAKGTTKFSYNDYALPPSPEHFGLGGHELETIILESTGVVNDEPVDPGFDASGEALLASLDADSVAFAEPVALAEPAPIALRVEAAPIALASPSESETGVLGEPFASSASESSEGYFDEYSEGDSEDDSGDEPDITVIEINL